MSRSNTNTLEGLLEADRNLAKRARDRAGLAEIASLLLQLRHELNLSQSELARRSGVPKTTISELENAANDGVTLRTLVKLARGAGTSLNLGFELDSAMSGTVTASFHTASSRSAVTEASGAGETVSWRPRATRVHRRPSCGPGTLG